MKKGLLATLLTLTASLVAPDPRRQRQPQHYRALPEKSEGHSVVTTPPRTESEMKRVKERHRQRKAKRGY